MHSSLPTKDTIFFPANTYLFTVNNRNTRKRYEVCSELMKKIPERCQWCHSVILIVNFDHIAHLFLVFLLLKMIWFFFGIANIYLTFRCMYRVLDSFGTYVEFNFPSYPYDVPGNRSGWGNLNLIPTQFMTLYRKWGKNSDEEFTNFIYAHNIPIAYIHT